MARKKKVEPPTPPPNRRPWQVLGTLTAAVGLLGLLAWLGTFAARTVSTDPRFVVPLDAIDFEAPPLTTRETLLTEVRYSADLPERFNLLLEEDRRRVDEAFNKHPWIKPPVVGTVTADRRYRVSFTVRTAVLAVRCSDGEPPVRMVDETGVLLPAVQPPMGLAELVGEYPVAGTTAGMIWNHATVVRAAELTPRFDTKSIEKTSTGWVITERTGRKLVVSW
jgi:hypothetical protein